MKKVTALRSKGNRGAWVRVYLDDKFAFSLETEVVVKEGLMVGQELDSEQIGALVKADELLITLAIVPGVSLSCGGGFAGVVLTVIASKRYWQS